MKIKFIPVFLVTTTVAMVTMVLMARLGAPTRASIHQTIAAHEADAKAIAADWANHRYVPFGTPEFAGNLTNLVANANGSATLDDRQKSGLHQELMGFFHAYSDGAYESYRAFRLPAGISFDWKTNKYGSIDEVLHKPPGFGPPNAYLRWHAQIEAKKNSFDGLPREEKFKVFLQLFSGGNWFSNYFSAACFEQSHIIISDFTNEIVRPWKIAFKTPNSFLTNSASVAAPFPNLGYFAQKPRYSLITFEDSIEFIRDQFGAVKVADCYFFVRRPAPDPVLPVIARFYWNPNATRWLPDDVVVCSVWHKGDNWPLF